MQTPEFQRISPQEALRLISEEEAAIVDIRDAASFSHGKMTGSVLIDNSNAEEFALSADKSKPLIVCCYHGNSSQNAAAWFASQGFTHACSLDGGFEQWKLLFPDHCE